MTEMTDKILAILDKNKDKDFVRRILDPKGSPSIDLGKGFTGTHLMATAEADGKHYAYPTIQRDFEGNLVRLEPNEAFTQAKERGELIEFSSAEEALWFSKNYKSVWKQ